MRLVAYVRVSTAAQAVDGYGVDAQREAILTWAAGRHRIVAWHSDLGISGATDVGNRPGLSAALDGLRSADGLVVARLDRLARSLSIQEAVLAVVWRGGGRVFTADAGEILRDDPDDPMRTAMRQMVGMFAELDRRMVVKRLRDGRRAKAASGGRATGSYPYGLGAEGKGRRKVTVPKVQEQAAVARVAELRAAGASYRQIAAMLDSEGFSPRRAQRWSAMSVRSIALRA